jgi:predicted transcriptional regulator
MMLLSDMKKITVAVDDDVYMKLVDYVAERSKKTKSRLSMSDSARELLSIALERAREGGAGGENGA